MTAIVHRDVKPVNVPQCGPVSTRRLAFRGDRNRPGRFDVTGAFAPEALRFVKHRPGEVHVVSLTAPRAVQRAEMARIIAAVRPDELGLFCHGYRARVELGYDVATADDLAAVLAEVGCSRVALHACSTGSDAARGFAATLAREMVAAGLDDVRVLGSQTPGHASMNPHRRLFDGTGWQWIVEPRSASWKRWCARMRAADDPLRWELCERTADETRAAV